MTKEKYSQKWFRWQPRNLYDEQVTDLDELINSIINEKKEWHKKNYAEIIELCNKALESK